MYKLSDMIITEIENVTVVHSLKGRNFEMTDRKLFGFSLCESGQITYTMNGNRYISDSAHAVILPKGATYTLHGDKEGLFPLINFRCLNFECDSILTIPVKDRPACLNDFKKIKSLFPFKENRLRVYSIFYGLLNRLEDESYTESNMLYPVIKYIENNLSSPTLSNTVLAQKAHISEIYLRRMFKADMGISPKQYILNARIQKAKQLLSESNLKVNAVAEECGFSSVYHFSRCFKEKTGMTPTEYMTGYRLFEI